MNARNKVLELLFNENEKTCVGKAKSTSIVNPFLIEGEYYCVNPLSSVDVGHNQKPYYSYMKPRRADINVKEFRNFVFEIDELSLEQQEIIIREIDIEFSAVVYSGGKSFHCIICLENGLGGNYTQNGIDNYKHVWNRIAAKIDAKSVELGFGDRVVDPSCKNPSRFTRYPEYKSEGRERQEVKQCSLTRFTDDQFNALLLTCPEIQSVGQSKAIERGDVGSVSEFWKVASKGLKNAVRYPIWAKSSTGLYPEALKVVLWAIDETNIGKDLLVKIFEKTVFRQYKNVDYPQEKWYSAIDDAYRLKGVC